MAPRIKNLYKPAATWALNNPVLLDGELGIESDTNSVKVGDGVSTWTQLEYTVEAPPAPKTPAEILGVYLTELLNKPLGRWIANNSGYTYPSPAICGFTSKMTANDSGTIYVIPSTGYVKFISEIDGDFVYGAGNLDEVIPIQLSPNTTDGLSHMYALMACDEDGQEVVGSTITFLNLSTCKMTSFDGSGLSSLTTLYINSNQLTSFDCTGLSNLLTLDLSQNRITTFSGVGLSVLYNLQLQENLLTSFSKEGLNGSLTYLDLSLNSITSFSGTGLINLQILNLGNNNLSYFNGTALTSVEELYLQNNKLGSFSGVGMNTLREVNLQSNRITSFDGTGLGGINRIDLYNNLLESFDGLSMYTLRDVYLHRNNLSTVIVPSGLDTVSDFSIYLSGGVYTQPICSDGTALNAFYETLPTFGGAPKDGPGRVIWLSDTDSGNGDPSIATNKNWSINAWF